MITFTHNNQSAIILEPGDRILMKEITQFCTNPIRIEFVFSELWCKGVQHPVDEIYSFLTPDDSTGEIYGVCWDYLTLIFPPPTE